MSKAHINKSELAERILKKMVLFLQKKKTKLSSPSPDGRMNSLTNEEEILNDLKSFEASNEWFQKNCLEIHIPEIRDWFDFAIENKDKDIFIPVNIKVSECKKNQADNLNCKLGIFYALTGIHPSKKKISQGIGWDKYFSKLSEHMSTYTDCDYYFLVINKNDKKDVFFSSLKQLKTLTPNGSNLPFQCKWNNNRERIKRTHNEAKEFIETAFGESIHKIKVIDSFEKYMSKQK